MNHPTPLRGSTAALHMPVGFGLADDIHFKVVRVSSSGKCITIQREGVAPITCYRRKDGTYWHDGQLFTIKP